MSIQYDVMREEDWGRDSCSHSHLEQELTDGLPTGNFRCEQCGRVFAAEEIASIEANRQQEVLRFE